MSTEEQSYELIQTGRVPIKAWTRGLGIEEAAQRQLTNISQLPIVFRHVAVMPDVHYGIGATVGSVVPTQGAIIPAAVGVDIGCGMMAVETSLDAKLLPDSLKSLRTAIEKAVPHGRSSNGGRGDRGAWHKVPHAPTNAWKTLSDEYKVLSAKHPRIGDGNDLNHLGTLGTGNHFIEVCLDERDRVWFMLHSGSRGVGNRIRPFFRDNVEPHQVFREREAIGLELRRVDRGSAVGIDPWGVRQDAVTPADVGEDPLAKGFLTAEHRGDAARGKVDRRKGDDPQQQLAKDRTDQSAPDSGTGIRRGRARTEESATLPASLDS